VAGYLLEEQVGAGGMAVVFRAHDERLGRTVALKLLAPGMAADEAFRQRFVRESRAAAAVDDPHILPVFEAGEATGVLFIAMRLVPGGDVHTLVREAGPLEPERAVLIVSQAASALDAAHRRGLIHRDVKPANMLMDVGDGGRPDHIYLSDFGLSKTTLATGLTAVGTVVGTAEYMAPEQIDGGVVDGRTDQYALACAAFELLSGQTPFRREEAMAVLFAHLSGSPPSLAALRPGLPAGVDAVFARALAKPPEQRYPTCGDFGAALRAALGIAHESSAPGRPGLPTQISAPRGADTPTPKLLPEPPRHAPRPASPAPAHRRVAAPALIAVAILVAGGAIAAAILLAGSPDHHAATGSSRPPGAGTAAHSGRTSPTPSAPAGAVHYSLVGSPLDPGAGTVSITGVSWNRANTLVATSDKNNVTYVWDVATGVLRHRFRGPSKAFFVAFSPDGTELAVAYSDASTWLWNVATGQVIGRLHDPGGSEVDTVAFSPNGATLAASDGNGSVYLWQLGGAVPALARSLPDPAGHGVWSVAFSSGGMLASGDYYGNVYLWQPGSSTPQASFSMASPGSSGFQPVTALAFNADGRMLAAADQNGRALLWDVSTSSSVPLAPPAGYPVWGVSFGGSLLALADGDGRAYLWRIGTQALAATSAGSLADPGSGGDGIGALAFSSDGKHLVTGDTNGRSYLWQAR
jgi:serine/threonine-protein kinase